MDRALEELELLKQAYPNLERKDSGGNIWVKIPGHKVAGSLWKRNEVDIAFKIPSQAGEAPYGFFVLSKMELKDEKNINNYTFPATTPFDGEWGQFSWTIHPDEPWVIRSDIKEGSNMLKFVRSFNDRLKEGA